VRNPTIAERVPPLRRSVPLLQEAVALFDQAAAIDLCGASLARWLAAPLAARRSSTQSALPRVMWRRSGGSVGVATIRGQGCTSLPRAMSWARMNTCFFPSSWSAAFFAGALRHIRRCGAGDVLILRPILQLTGFAKPVQPFRRLPSSAFLR